MIYVAAGDFQTVAPVSILIRRLPEDHLAVHEAVRNAAHDRAGAQLLRTGRRSCVFIEKSIAVEHHIAGDILRWGNHRIKDVHVKIERGHDAKYRLLHACIIHAQTQFRTEKRIFIAFPGFSVIFGVG